jgi:hypothetical protein
VLLQLLLLQKPRASCWPVHLPLLLLLLHLLNPLLLLLLLSCAAHRALRYCRSQHHYLDQS